MSFVNISQVIGRAHSFPQKILPNSAARLMKFRGSPAAKSSKFRGLATASHLWLKTERAVQKLQLLNAGIVLKATTH